MAIKLSPSERDDLQQRYLRAHGEQGIEILGPSVQLDRNGSSPIEFALDTEVEYTRPDTATSCQPRVITGTIVLFVRINDERFGWERYAVILADGEHGQRRQYRVAINLLRHANPETSNG